MAGRRGNKVKDAMDAAKPVDDDAFDLYGGAPANDQGGDDYDSAEPDDIPFDGDNDGAPAGLSAEQLAAAETCAALDQNDRDNGKRLLVWFGANLAYVPGMGWLTFRGTHWQRDEGELDARRMAQDVVDCIKLECFFIRPSAAQKRLLEAAGKVLDKPASERTADDLKLVEKAEKAMEQVGAKKGKRRNFAVSSGNAGKTGAMLIQAASHKAVDQAVLDANAMQFNVRNGTLVFSREPDPEQDLTPEADGKPIPPRLKGKVTFVPHDRTDMITKRAEVDYDPDATCPLFMEFLVTTQQRDLAMIRFLQVFHAYALLCGGNGEQKLVYHFGTGANGKSVFIETLGRLAGSYRTTVSPDTITGDTQRGGQQASPDIARLHNTRMAIVEELPRGTPLKDNLIKAVSGGGVLTARFLQKEIFEFIPMFVAVLSGNDMPEISGTDFGIWRRVLIAHWEVTIPEDQRRPFGEMLDMFDAERSGILNWLVEGMMLYLEHGLTPFIPAKVTEFTQDYREERDPVGNFVKAHVRESKGSKVPAGKVYKAYEAWCAHNGEKPWNATNFGKRFTAMGHRKERGHTVNYLDIELFDVIDAGNIAAPSPDDYR